MTNFPKESKTFWNTHYSRQSARSNGQPSRALARFAADRAPGTSLDLGCSRGDDVLWLARQGWKATGVDVSDIVLGYAHENAERAGLSDAVHFAQCDLANAFPSGRFDLVSASFLQTPLDFPRLKVLRQAAFAVSPGGLLLVAEHGSYAPWQWGDPNNPPPPAREKHAELELRNDHWREVFVGEVRREARGPSGQTADVLDSIIAIERKI